ncbi:MAG: L,D-transpeptidase family protein [Mucilaginibacter sp.]|nr:L,D-transpeptidase family protein [Mucilaginibacter sp.]
MGSLVKSTSFLKPGKGVYAFFCFSILLVHLSVHSAAAGYLRKAVINPVKDTACALKIQQIISDNQIESSLNYPKSVKRFYDQNGYQPAWIKPQSGFGQTWQAMLMLDCVLQYGLAHADYHPKELVYERLHNILEKPEKYDVAEKARFEITLTDALITFMNHLHFGKLNPDFPSNKIDIGNTAFHAEATLLEATRQNDFMSALVKIQPQSKEYLDMQDHTRLLVGQYQADCYEIPQEDIRIMAINMERMRWFATDDKTYIKINIPSYSLWLQLPDTAYQFKVIVGKPSSPTPTLQSQISYFTTAPEWKVPKSIFVKEILPKALKDTSYLENNHFTIYDNKGKYIGSEIAELRKIKSHPGNFYARQSSGCDNSLGLIIFRFQNIYDIYLHDTPEQLLFAKQERAFSHSCIRVEHAEKLAGLLLKNDGAANKLPALRQALKIYQTKNFLLKKPVPIKTTYLTCEVKEGLLIKYRDPYNLDGSLEMALYNTEMPLTMR